MVGEEILFNYGVLGVWTFVNLLTIKFYRDKEQKREDKLINVIEENTRIISAFNVKLDNFVRRC